MEGIIKCQMEAPHDGLEGEMEPRKEATVFDKPTKGTSVETFREMINNHFKVRKKQKCIQIKRNQKLQFDIFKIFHRLKLAIRSASST